MDSVLKKDHKECTTSILMPSGIEKICIKILAVLLEIKIVPVEKQPAKSYKLCCILFSQRERCVSDIRPSIDLNSFT